MSWENVLKLQRLRRCKVCQGQMGTLEMEPNESVCRYCKEEGWDEDSAKRLESVRREKLQ